MQGQALANGTKGRTDWNTIDWTKANRLVRNLRQRIFRATREGDWTKVRSLQKLMLRSYANTLMSVRRVTQVNAGKTTPGVDKVVVKTPAERGQLVAEMRTLTPWRAKPVKRVYIPKANGKLRPLGIPVIRDRVLQAMVKNMLEPSWEARFEGTSYGFRPGRSAQDALKKIYHLVLPNTRLKWILDADIKSAFDQISHDYLLETIGPVPGKELIRQWLKAGYVEMGTYHETLTGTPQGGVISPLLANIALHGMETALGVNYDNRGRLNGNCAVVRYADDFVVVCQTHEQAQAARTTLTQWLAIRGLQFSEEKTRIVPISQGFDFLGFNVKHYQVSTTRTGWKLLIIPSKTSIQKLRLRLREEWLALKGHNLRDILIRLNPLIRGWANYFRTQVAMRTFSKLDHYMNLRERRYVYRMHPNKSRHWAIAKYFGKLNPSKRTHWVFGDKDSGAYLLMFKWFNIIRHTLVKGTHSPDDPALRPYWKKRELAKVKFMKPNLKRLALNQEGKCPKCGESLFIEENIEQHHVMARTVGGPNTDDNKVLLHYFCHQQLSVFQRKHGFDTLCS
jgi:RNA-directed DNA polymerase